MLKEEPSSRVTYDLQSGEDVDKAIAFIIGKPGTNGDVLYFKSTRPHEWTNPGDEPAVFLGVNTPPTF